MKTRNAILLSLLVLGWTGGHAQPTFESEVPGDNFSLEGALELFKRSSSPEEFERLLNSPDSKVNNLDLNNDNYIDYIKVIDRYDYNVHAFILQAVVSERESQDVAVIELEKLHNGKAVLQITGDADIYGIETIIEPTENVQINTASSTVNTVVNVWTWPSVQYVYGPYYRTWVSPWGWSHRPVWWRSGSPVSFNVYIGWWRPYRPYYTACHTHRIGYLPRLYRPYRTTSVYVCNNYRPQITYYRSHHDRRSHYDRRWNDRHDRNHAHGGHSRSDYHRYNHHGSSTDRTHHQHRDRHRERDNNDWKRNNSDRQNTHRTNSSNDNFTASRSQVRQERSFDQSTIGTQNSSERKHHSSGAYRSGTRGETASESRSSGSSSKWSYEGASQGQGSKGSNNQGRHSQRGRH